MAGITSYGAYIPPTRLPLALIDGGAAKPGGPEKAVAWNDEDSVTMAVTAAVNCLRGIDRQSVDGLIFASTTYPFQEKQGAALIAKALDLRRDVQTADHGGSLRAGMTALRAGLDSVAAGSARSVLVVASDSRMAVPGSALERNLGDAAVAFLIGERDAIAVREASYAVADEIIDVWRGAGESFVHSWEDRFVQKHGYSENMRAALRGLLERSGIPLEDFSGAALYGSDARAHAALVRALGLAADRVQEPFFGRLGSTGTAFALLLLAARLERARPGERLLLAAYGDGAEAMALGVTDAIEKLETRRGVRWHLERRRPVQAYDRYLKARSLQSAEYETPRNQGLSATIHFRERDEEISLRGQRCRGCSAVQFPMQRVCETCFRKDEFDPLRLSDRIGRVLTYTFDYFFPTPDPPTIATIVEVEGARLHMQLIDVAPEDVELDMPVEFVFRKIHESGGRPNYYWKCTPRA